MIRIALNSYWLSNMGNVQGDANGISGRGCTGACNAVNTTLTTDAQLQKRGEWLLGALGLAEKLRSPAAHCLKASPFACWGRPTALAFWQATWEAAWSSFHHQIQASSAWLTWILIYQLVAKVTTGPVVQYNTCPFFHVCLFIRERENLCHQEIISRSTQA